tara:strand:- start:6699 stop:7625 length:927 start_codon:yes stop_codon:yes gene_type:complete
MQENYNTSEYYYKMVNQYLLTPNSLGINSKPYLWIHLHNDNNIIPSVNQRSWLNFGSRNTKDFNQPYQYLTIKSIIDKCSNDFNICLIDDFSFKKILPEWKLDLNNIANPIKNHLRLLALSTLLNIYGGMIVPSSFICFKSLKSIYDENIRNKKMFVGEFINRTSSEYTIHNDLIAYTYFMGCNANNNIMLEFIKYQEVINSSDFTCEMDFLGKINIWLDNCIKNQTINIIDGKYLGTKNSYNKPILIEELLGTSFINLYDNAYGLYIPWNDLINRTKFQWFTQLSPQQVLESNTIIGNYLLIANSHE